VDVKRQWTSLKRRTNDASQCKVCFKRNRWKGLLNDAESKFATWCQNIDEISVNDEKGISWPFGDSRNLRGWESSPGRPWTPGLLRDLRSENDQKVMM
jgi:hypothetical protein